MSGLRAVASAGIVGAVLWAFKHEAERGNKGQGALAPPQQSNFTQVGFQPDQPKPDNRLNLVNAAFELFSGFGQAGGKVVDAGKRQITHSQIGGQLMNDLQRDFGLARHQAAGVVGNLDHESGGFKSLQEIKPLIPGSRGGYGYAQWTGPRRRNFEAWVKARGLDPRSYAANYGFLKHELTQTDERRVLPRLRRAKTVEEAARVFSGSSQRGNSFDGFLRPGIPHMDSRISRARRYA